MGFNCSIDAHDKSYTGFIVGDMLWQRKSIKTSSYRRDIFYNYSYRLGCVTSCVLGALQLINPVFFFSGQPLDIHSTVKVEANR